MPRILIAEDEKDMAMGLRDNLQFEGYEVVIAEDGEAAMKAVVSGYQARYLAGTGHFLFRENPIAFNNILRGTIDAFSTD